jgi:16S rRNA (cytosine967-C5)-methyltransferase
MTPGGRAQAAIDLLDEIVRSAREGGAAADTLIARYFKTRRYAGSGDRRAIRELVYRAVRRAGDVPASGRAALLAVAADDPAVASLFDGSPHGPAQIGADEQAAEAGIAPAWLTERLSASLDGDEVAALLTRAPLDIRVNRLKSDRATVAAAFPDARPTPHAPLGLRFDDPIAIDRHPLWEAGAIEVQDEGSQLIAAAATAPAPAVIVDLCAGAGGKTLAIAADMAGAGQLVACDTDRGRLSRLAPRAERAGVEDIETRLLDPGRELESLDDLAGRADVVLVDAPCSGTGTWRRNPEARWRLTPDRLARLVLTQARLLDIAAALVRPGGKIVYAVCSLLDDEGADQIAAFRLRQPDWTPALPFDGVGRARGDGVVLSPARDGTDGFFVAKLVRPC